MDHRDGQLYNLANIFMLWPPLRHYPSVMSSYYWSNDSDQSAPATARARPAPPRRYAPAAGRTRGRSTWTCGDVPANCSDTFEDGKWVCEHRRTSIANMVRFRWVTDGEAVTNWQNVSS